MWDTPKSLPWEIMLSWSKAWVENCKGNNCVFLCNEIHWLPPVDTNNPPASNQHSRSVFSSWMRHFGAPLVNLSCDGRVLHTKISAVVVVVVAVVEIRTATVCDSALLLASAVSWSLLLRSATDCHDYSNQAQAFKGSLMWCSTCFLLCSDCADNFSCV